MSNKLWLMLPFLVVEVHCVSKETYSRAQRGDGHTLSGHCCVQCSGQYPPFPTKAAGRSGCREFFVPWGSSCQGLVPPTIEVFQMSYSLKSNRMVFWVPPKKPGIKWHIHMQISIGTSPVSRGWCNWNVFPVPSNLQNQVLSAFETNYSNFLSQWNGIEKS